MKKLPHCPLAMFVIIILIAGQGCLKKDIRFDKHQNIQCNIRTYSSIPYDGLSFGNGMIKIFDDFGRVIYFATAIAGNFDVVDSVWYEMRYRFSHGAIVADITVLKKNYMGAISSPDHLVPTEYDATESYTITAWFDISTGHLSRINGTGGFLPEDFYLQYKKGKLIKFGRFELVYDNHGDIIRVPKRDPALDGRGGILYYYDPSKTANRQMYVTSGYNVHEFYNLAEACEWIPVAPRYLRVEQAHSFFSTGTMENGHDDIAGRRFFQEHTLDGKGFLISYTTGWPVGGIPDASVINDWRCKVYNKKDFKHFLAGDR